MLVWQGKFRNHYSTYKWKTPEWFNDAAQSVINVVWNSWYTKLSRLRIIHISYHDTWNLDDTLAPIILKGLKRMEKHGAPFVDDEDVPDELKSINAPPKENEWDTDDFWFKRWDYVYACMVWSFEQLVDGTWEDQFHTGEIKWNTEPIDPNDPETSYRVTDAPGHTHKFDKEGHKAYSERIQNGLRLFGKYYQGLWC